jgi:2-oxoglutarate dehydrogenase E2 component (dihydrolipoamide succinyltransferase)
VIVEVKVPVFAESIQEGTVLAWLKQPGDTVRRGEHLVDIETDKIVLEVVAPEDGILDRILKAQGEAVESEAVLASIDTEYGAREPGFEVAPPQVIPIESPAVAAEAPPLGPAARKLVAEHAIDAAAIRGTGREGRVTRADVRSFLETRAEASAPPPPSAVAPSPATPVPTAPRVEPERPPARPPAAPPPPAPGRGERREPLSRIRARIAERLVEAQRRAALLTTFNEIDMQAVAELRARHRESFEKTHGVRLGLMSFFVKAAVEALRRYPAVNAFIEQDAIVYHDYYDVGVAVGSPRGLVVPILRDADRLSFADIERQIGGFAERARDGKLKPEELVGGTFTITNGGVFGSLLSTPIVNPPQSAILGMHKIEERPVAENRQVVVRPMMYVALTYDHRIIDGREAVRFLVTIKEAIEEPARLLLGI